MSTLADVECKTPVVERERARDRNCELPLCGELCEFAEHVVAPRERRILRRGVLPVEDAAHAECGGTGEVDNGEDAPWIAADHPNKVGQGTTHRARHVHRRDVECQVDWRS